MGLAQITGFAVQQVSKHFDYTWIIFGVLILFIFIFALHHFLDMAIDIWKLPFAVVIDAIDLLSYDNGYFDLTAAVSAFVLFTVLTKRGNYVSKVFGILAALEAMVGIWFFPQYAYITNLLPICTLFTFLLIWKH